jgi:hypothetical protein
MSRATQIEFERLVALYHQRHKNALHLSNPSFEEDGYITTATMIGLGGHVETRCGPAEYHAEIFVFTFDEQKRWDLAELMSIESVRNWLVSYSNNSNLHGKSSLEADVEWIFLILADGLKNVGKFDWLYRK